MSNKGSDLPVEELARELAQSKKYRQLDLCLDTVRDVIAQEARTHTGSRTALDAARKKLHNIVAPYLGDPDYPQAAARLDQAFQSRDAAQIRQACAEIMQAHVSTRERLPLLEGLYPALFALTGMPHTILDLACGLHPLSLPWMGLPATTQYHAYDILAERVGFLNHFFTLHGLASTAKVQDILVNPPTETGDVAFVFKEIHRFEQRQRGVTLKLLDALQVPYIVVSLPTQNMSGQIDFTESYRRMFYKIVGQRAWTVREVVFPGEMFFVVNKVGFQMPFGACPCQPLLNSPFANKNSHTQTTPEFPPPAPQKSCPGR